MLEKLKVKEDSLPNTINLSDRTEIPMQIICEFKPYTLTPCNKLFSK